MTTVEVQEIAANVYWKHNQELVNGLVQLKPTMTTKEVCKFLNVERHWLSKNRHLFNGKVINKRGDLNFEASKVVTYKRRKLVG